MIQALFDKWIFALLIIGAVSLWLATGLIFTQDELSALSRLHFDSFAELIEGGVKTDYHPALVQVILYIWTAVVGTSELAVKLPFILAGVGTLCLTFRLSCQLYDRSIALILVSLIAFSQYYAFYFSIARPYAFGTFFVLLQINALYSWKKGKKHKGLNLAAFILAAVFAAWTHYFALVAAGLVGVWGFFWLDRKDLIKYSASCFGALVLFSPHLPLTLYHLSKEGIGGEGGWLGPPEVDVWWEYFFFLGQYTWIGVALIIGSFIQSLFILDKMNSDQKKFMLLGLLLMFGLFSLAYFYSIFNTPVFQYSILIFGSIPFLMAAIGSWVSSARIVKRALLVLSIGAGLYGIFMTMAYPNKMRYQLYDDIAMQVSKANKQEQSPVVLSVMNAGFLGEYGSRNDLSDNYIESPDKTLDELRVAIDNAESGAIVQVTSPTEFLFMVQDEFGGQTLLRPAYELWRSDIVGSHLLPLADTSDGTKALLAQGTEYGPSVEYTLPDLRDDPFLILVLDIEVDAVPFIEGNLVCELYSDDEQLIWRGSELAHSGIQLKDGRIRVYNAIRLQDVMKDLKGNHDLKLKSYFWNISKQEVEVYPIRLRVYPDTPTRYGFFEKWPSGDLGPLYFLGKPSS